MLRSGTFTIPSQSLNLYFHLIPPAAFSLFTLCCLPSFKKPWHAHIPCLLMSGACSLRNMQTLNPYLNSWECGTLFGWQLRPHLTFEVFIAKHILYTQSLHYFCLWIGLFKADCKPLQSQSLSALDIIVYVLIVPHSYTICQRVIWVAGCNQ